MEHPALSPRTRVADLLAASPLMVTALLELRTDCVGCSMNRFCTLQEMCNQYGLEIEVVMKFLQERMRFQPGAKNP